MANLIITVIAIVLVAVASLMGAYYGGQAFLTGSEEARATALVNQGSQIGGAISLATVRDLTTLATVDEVDDLADGSAGWSSGPYLSGLPVPPDQAQPTGLTPGTDLGATWEFVNPEDTGTAITNVTDGSAAPKLAAILQVTQTLCNEIAGTGGTLTADLATLDDWIPAGAETEWAQNQFFCATDTDAASGTPAPSYYMVYKIR